MKWEIVLRETLSEVMFLIPGMVVRPPTSWTRLVRKEGRVGDQMGERGEERKVRAWAGGRRGRRVEQSSLFYILTSNYVGEFQSGVS